MNQAPTVLSAFIHNSTHGRAAVPHSSICNAKRCDTPAKLGERLFDRDVRGPVATGGRVGEGTADPSNAFYLDTADFVLLTSADLYDLSLARNRHSHASQRHDGVGAAIGPAARRA